MNTGHLQVERAEAEQAKAERGHLYEAKTGNHQGLIVDENSGKNVAVTYDKKDAAEMVRRWNAYPRLMKALRTIEAKLHEGDEEDGSDDGEYVQDVRNLHGDYIGQLSDLGTIARGAIAVAAK